MSSPTIVPPKISLRYKTLDDSLPSTESFEQTDYGIRDCEYKIHSLLQNKKGFDLQVGDSEKLPDAEKKKRAPRANDLFLMRAD